MIDRASRGRRSQRWIWVAVGALSGLLAVGVAAGCRMKQRRADPEYAGPSPLPPELAQVFAYPPADVPVETTEQPEAADDGFRVLSCRFQFPELIDGKPLPMRAEFFRTDKLGPDGRAPCVIVLPILGGEYGIDRSFATALARAGFHAFLPLREETEVVDPRRDAEGLNACLVASTVRLRRCVDWLAARPEVDSERLGVMGTSLGGMRAVILAGVEPRLRACVFLMAGGDLARVIAGSVEREVVDFRRARMAADGLDARGLEERLRERLVADPLRLAPHIDARRVLCFVSTRDKSVPTACQEALYQALGRPEAWSIPTGHYTAVLFMRKAQALAADWFRARFGMK